MLHSRASPKPCTAVLGLQQLYKVFLSLVPLPHMQVQLQLLTAIVKLFLKKPTETQELVQQVLSLATQVRAMQSQLQLGEVEWGQW